MKTVSGSIISCKPISLSKAASILSAFVSAETGASQAVSAYLKRSSSSFNELVQFHRESKAGRSEHKHKKIRSEMVDNGNLTDAEANPREDGLAVERILDLGEEEKYRYRGNSEGGGFDDERMNSLRKTRKKSDFSEYGPEAKDGDGVGIEERKKRKKEGIDDGGLDAFSEQHSRNKKRRRSEGEK